MVTFPESEVTEPSAVLLTVCLTSKEFTGGLEISPTPRTHSLTYTVIVYHSNREVLLPRLSESTPATCTIHIVPGSQTFRERERERERERRKENCSTASRFIGTEIEYRHGRAALIYSDF